MIKTLIVGLGNPGSQYENTPHNVGFAVIDALAKKLDATGFIDEKKFSCQLTRVGDVLLAKPQTYMNKSGDAVCALASYYKIPTDHIFIIHDEFNVPLGQLKISQGKGPGTHNGVLSIAHCLGTNDFIRFRFGIGKASVDNLEHYVLQPLAITDRTLTDTMVDHSVQALTVALVEGIGTAMNYYNT